ncbi:hypothetical protein JCGZ_07698 [Jatropha curcas]|uniref:DUF1639 family protein n=1 Tax=Jatropha curcas TaxID=180498 RepID=A0A067KDB9_JATCU|nr:DEP domain-containing protein DDB_G0279099 [Jatropha curcas]XP_020536505.1 DEP domain-containing protein DDB_G0279099 [Jatropha curcas]KDP34127.1 hypothetical protein JCGZ_07698 [Jatropha curcas]
MEKDYLRSNNNVNTNNNHKIGGADGLLRAISDSAKQTTSDFVLQWGNRKRLRCMKIQVKDDSNTPVHRTTVRVDRRVVRADKETSNQPSTTNNNSNQSNQSNVYLNLRQRPSSPPPPPPQRVLRNSENLSAMRGQSNGGVRSLSSPDRAAHDKRNANNNHNNHHHHHNSNHENKNNNNNHNNNNKSGASSETAHDSKKGGGSSSGSGEAAPPVVWPPKFVIALTNKEKEEDFIAFKGSKLPQRPKKRAKFVQRTLNLVSPGAWLCDLTLERYEVREKKIAKKRPRGLKAMGNMDSDSE